MYEMLKLKFVKHVTIAFFQSCVEFLFHCTIIIYHPFCFYSRRVVTNVIMRILYMFPCCLVSFSISVLPTEYASNLLPYVISYIILYSFVVSKISNLFICRNIYMLYDNIFCIIMYFPVL